MKDGVLDAATRQAQVAATAAAFLKTMEEDELLHVVPEEPNAIDTLPGDINISAKEVGDNIELDNKRRFSRNIEMNQIHDDLYRQLTGALFITLKYPLFRYLNPALLKRYQFPLMLCNVYRSRW